MGRFRRRKNEDAEQVDDVDVDVDLEPADDDDVEVPVAPGRPQGPWDEADAPDDGAERLDLGGLRVPVPPQTEVRVDVSPQGEVVAATLVRGPSAMQVNVFAAPRTDGIWDEVREEIGTALREGGGRAEDAEGPFGTELRAAVPTEVPGQGRVLAPARFLGVDGPRWFVRALLTGPAATDATAAGDLEQALRAVVVVRGIDPMAVRDPLPLRLPQDIVDKAAERKSAEQGTSQPQAPGVPERGPEITEIR